MRRPLNPTLLDFIDRQHSMIHPFTFLIFWRRHFVGATDLWWATLWTCACQWCTWTAKKRTASSATGYLHYWRLQDYVEMLDGPSGFAALLQRARRRFREDGSGPCEVPRLSRRTVPVLSCSARRGNPSCLLCQVKCILRVNQQTAVTQGNRHLLLTKYLHPHDLR